MYGWPPGYNKANSAELSRQLVPQHVLPLVLPCLPLFPVLHPSPFRRYIRPRCTPAVSHRISHSFAPREYISSRRSATEYIYMPPRRAAHVRLLKRFHPEENARLLSALRHAIPFIVQNANVREEERRKRNVRSGMRGASKHVQSSGC